MSDTPSTYKESVNYYKTQLDYKLQDVVNFASDIYDVEEEVKRGTMEFVPLVCRITNAISPKTGHNQGDDFKEIIFQDLEHNVELGQRFRFSNNIWLVSNSDDNHYITKSAIIRRCNNELRWMENGEIVSEPCILGYTSKYSNIYYNDAINIPQGTVVITAQFNQNTKKIKINDRFLLGNSAYKIKSVIDYLRLETFVKDSQGLIEFEVYLDNTAPDDDFELQIADKNKYNNQIPDKPSPEDYSIVITPENKDVLQGQSKMFSCYLYLNGVRQNDVFSFIPSGVPDSYYKMEILNENQFTIHNLKYYSKNPLHIECKTFGHESSVDIRLRGLY